MEELLKSKKQDKHHTVYLLIGARYLYIVHLIKKDYTKNVYRSKLLSLVKK